MNGITSIRCEMASTTYITKVINILLIRCFFFVVGQNKRKTELTNVLNDAYQITNENSWTSSLMVLQINLLLMCHLILCNYFANSHLKTMSDISRAISNVARWQHESNSIQIRWANVYGEKESLVKRQSFYYIRFNVIYVHAYG